MTNDLTALESRYREIMTRIGRAAAATARAPAEITLVAVSKLQPVEAIARLYALGHRDFGENYVQELLAKAEALESRGCSGIRWHFIGHLQTNKVKQLLPWISTVHTVDSARLGGELAKRWRPLNHPEPLPVLLEVNIDQEASKSGLNPEEVPILLEELRTHPELRVSGLMCIPRPGPTPESARPSFRKLRELAATAGIPRPFALSMGMSDDFESAIAEGATHVRVGSALFGARPAQ